MLLEEYMVEVGPLGGDVNLESGRDECSVLCVSVHGPGPVWCCWKKRMRNSDCQNGGSSGVGLRSSDGTRSRKQRLCWPF